MMKTKKPNKVQTEASFLEAVASANENIYLILLTMHVIICISLEVGWNGNVYKAVENIRYGMLAIVMWGSALYLISVFSSWNFLMKYKLLLFLIAVGLLCFIGYFARVMTTNAYGVVMDIAFVVLACGKSFRKMLKCVLGADIALLLLAGIGLKVGFTLDMVKPDTDTPGHSLGINYPNTWGYLCFLALILIWYLYLRNKPYLTFPIFWASAYFNYFYITCRTIAGLSIIFPVLALIIDLLEKRTHKKIEAGTYKEKKIIKWFVVAIPFLALGFMFFMSEQIEWWYQYYHGALRNLAWRFIQSGLYFKHWGIPLFGNPYRSNVYIYENVCGEFIKVDILDSSFAAYMIMRGIVWILYTICLLTFAHWKAMKNKDYAIPLLETILLGFAMMERPGLEMWYNFILLYPLAKIVSEGTWLEKIGLARKKTQPQVE